MSKGLRVTLIILALLALLGLLVIGAGVWLWKTRGSQWQSEMRETGRQVMAEGAAAGAQATKDECTRLGIARVKQDPGLMGQVKAAVFTEHCLNAAQGELPLCAGVPADGAILDVVAWRMKTSAALGLDDPENGVVKGIQKHCER